MPLVHKNGRKRVKIYADLVLNFLRTVIPGEEIFSILHVLLNMINFKTRGMGVKDRYREYFYLLKVKGVSKFQSDIFKIDLNIN